MSTSPSPLEQRLARFLGWFSLALGGPQIASPGRVNRLIGVKDDRRSRAAQRVVGIRELAAAAGILSRPRPVAWLWARLAGDVKDLGLLASAWRSKAERPSRLAAATGSVVAITGVDLFTAARMSRTPEGPAHDREHELRAAITVGKPREEVYGFWHDFQNLPRFMAHLEAVQMSGNGRSHWKATAPAGKTIEWDAEIVEDRPNELIAWRSVSGGPVEHQGSVRFTPAPGDRGTEVRLHMQYTAPGGPLALTLAKLFGEDPKQQVRDDLRRFKQVMETGIVVRSDGTPEGTLARRQLKQRPARPLPAGASREGEPDFARSTS
jgi:uncharacterized membrane protein